MGGTNEKKVVLSEVPGKKHFIMMKLCIIAELSKSLLVLKFEIDRLIRFTLTHNSLLFILDAL